VGIPEQRLINMEFKLEEGIEVLRQTPSAINSLLRPLSNAWTESNEGPNTWSPFDVVGHLIHGEETDWIPRARIIMNDGQTGPFEPFDRMAMFEKSKGKSLVELLDTFSYLRSSNIQELERMNLTPVMLEKRGTHPELGAVTLAQLLAAWVVHDLGHISQIVRVMARQYREDVGPWSAYLSILHK
jgi:hypothetical protein